jgi:hypothetical protein
MKGRQPLPFQIHLNVPSTRAQPHEQEKAMSRFKIVDTGDTWTRQTEIDAEDYEVAQEIYIERCDEAGLVLGTLRVCRIH